MGSVKPSVEKVNTLTDEQQDILTRLNEATGGKLDSMINNLSTDIQGQQGYQQGQEALQSQLSQFDPEQVGGVFDRSVADPARKSFQEQTIPGITERLAGAGASRGSGAALALGGAAKDLETALSGQKEQALLSADQQQQQVRSNAIQQALQYAGAPGQEQLSAFDRYLQLVNQSQKSPYELGVNQGSAGLAPSLIQAGGTIAGGIAGGPAGAAIGSAVGNYFSGAK